MGVNITPSIIQDEPICYVTGARYGLDRPHHVFYGSTKRNKSEQYGLKIWLTVQAHYELHNSPLNAQYVTKEVADRIKSEVQQIAMKHYGWSMEDWMKIFRENYIL